MEYLCQYGNCNETDTTVTVTRKDGGTQRYCSELHAAAALLNLAQLKATAGEKANIYLAKAAVITMADQKV